MGNPDDTPLCCVVIYLTYTSYVPEYVVAPPPLPDDLVGVAEELFMDVVFLTTLVPKGEGRPGTPEGVAKVPSNGLPRGVTEVPGVVVVADGTPFPSIRLP